MQEALVAVAVRWRRLVGEHPEAHARQVIVRRHVSWCRRRRHATVTPDVGADDADPAAGLTSHHDPDGRLALERALAALTPRQRAVVVLRYHVDLTERDTAVALGCSVGTVKSRTHLALRRLREAAPGPRRADRRHLMTRPVDDLPESLHDLVADEPTIDLAGAAWAVADRRRRRRATGVVGAVTVVLATALLGARLADSGTSPSGPTAPPGVIAPARNADAMVGDVPVWFAPSPVEEQALPPVPRSPLPRRLDLDADVDRPAPGDAVLAAFWRPAPRDGGRNAGRVQLVDALGAADDVDVSRLEHVLVRGDEAWPAMTEEMLAPDGRHLMFPQYGAIAVYEVGTREWSRIDTQGRSAVGAWWLDAETIGIPLGDGEEAFISQPHGGVGVQQRAVPASGLPDGVDADFPYGAAADRGDLSARAWAVVGDPAAGGPLGGAGLIAVESDEGPRVLSLTHPLQPRTTRGKVCCPVAGWLDDHVLVYQSRAPAPVLVAWHAGTSRFEQVTTISGTYESVSFADLGD